MSDLTIRMRKLRDQKKLYQKDIARVLGIAPERYSKYETGAREPDIETLKMIATYFNVSVDYLIGFDDKTNLNKIALQEYIKTMEDSFSQLKKYINNSK